MAVPHSGYLCGYKPHNAFTMDLNSGLPYSLLRYGLVENYPKLSKNIRAEAVIIGGGISGALMGYELIKHGLDTVLIDARSVGLGSTSASSSLLLYEIDVPLYKLETLYGKKKAETAYGFSRDSIGQLREVAKKIGFKNFQDKESIYYAVSTRDIPLLKKEFDARITMGFDVNYLESKQLEKETGIRAKAAVISKLAAQTDAYLFTHALLKYSSEKGLKIYDRTKAVSADQGKSGVSIHLENGYTIRAKKIIYATGYEKVNFIEKSLVRLRSTYATVSESYPGMEEFWIKDRLIWNTADPYLYIRTTPDKRIMIGGRDEDFYSPLKRDRLIKSKTKLLASDIKKLFPKIDFSPEFSWTGTFGETKDGLPYIGTLPNWPHSYFSLGFGGNGITFSMIAAKIIAGEILGKKVKGSEVFSFDR